MLPLKTARYEVNRDYSLVFNSVELADLGPYVCQAYSGFGKPKSISVTLKAVGPVQTDDPELQPYLQYVLDPSQVPTAAPPAYKPLRPLPPTQPPTPEPAPPRNGKKRAQSFQICNLEIFFKIISPFSYGLCKYCASWRQ